MTTFTLRSIVPCGSCTLCCKLWTPLSRERGDKIEDYDVVLRLQDGKLKPYLNRKPNGDCVYLSESGCTIHDRAPVTCQEFDCRALFRAHDRRGRQLATKHGLVDKALFERGREFIEEQEQCR